MIGYQGYEPELRKTVAYSERVSVPPNPVAILHPPNGGEMVQIRFSFWRFFTSSKDRQYGNVIMDRDEAERLREILNEILRK